jgi:hypothetical protein
MIALAVLVGVATKTHDPTMGQRYGAALRLHIGKSAGPFEDARALLTLARFGVISGARESAASDLARSRAIAEQHAYHEVLFQGERLAAELDDAIDVVAPGTAVGHSSHTSVVLAQRSLDIVTQIDEMDSQYVWGRAVATT